MIREDTKKRAKCQVYLSIFQRAHSFGPLKAPSSQPTLSYRVGAEIKNELTHERARVKLAWTLLASEKEENEVKKRARKQIYLQFLSASTEHLAAKPFRHLVHLYCKNEGVIAGYSGIQYSVKLKVMMMYKK